MIIEKSLDKFLMNIMFHEFNTRQLVKAIETLPQANEDKKLIHHLLNSVNSLHYFKSGFLHYEMYSNVYTSNSYLLSLFSIDFVYDFFQSILAECPENQINIKILLNIFKDSYTAYAEEVGMTVLKQKMPELNENEINYITLLVNRFIQEDFSAISRGFQNAIIK